MQKKFPKESLGQPCLLNKLSQELWSEINKRGERVAFLKTFTVFSLAWVFVCNQLEELKQKQKLNRQKEHEKRRKLEAKKNEAKIKEKAEGKVGVCMILIL